MNKKISIILGALCLAVASPAIAQQQGHTLMAVFAHADDEILVSPILARYGREGADVYLVFVTRSDSWAPQTELAKGDQIAKVRAEEAHCAARALGIHPPIILPFDDGSLGERVIPPWSTLSKLESRLRKLFADIKPDVVITWGPDGGYGHPDHRLVGSVVTELIQRKIKGAPQHLFYAAIPSDRVPDWRKSGNLPWVPIDMEYLTVKVPYTEADLVAAKKSFKCYKSQFSKESLHLGALRLHNENWDRRIYLRPWFGAVQGQDLLSLDPIRGE